MNQHIQSNQIEQKKRIDEKLTQNEEISEETNTESK